MGDFLSQPQQSISSPTPLYVKALLGALVLFILLLLGYIIKLSYDVNSKQSQLNDRLIESKQLADQIIRSQSSAVSKEEFQNYAKSLGLNLQKIQEDLDQWNTTPHAINSVTVSTSGSHQNNLPSSSSVPVPSAPAPSSPDPFGYLTHQQQLKLAESIGSSQVPFGQATFQAWDKNPWGLTVFPRSYTVKTVIATTEDGKEITYNEFSLETQGKVYKLPISKSSTVQVLPEAKFRFSPRLQLALDGGVNTKTIQGELLPHVQVSLFSYGMNKSSPAWTFGNLGVGYATQARKPAATLTPVTFNLGHYIPMMDNLHLGATVSLDSLANFSILGGVRVGL